MHPEPRPPTDGSACDAPEEHDPQLCWYHSEVEIAEHTARAHVAAKAEGLVINTRTRQQVQVVPSTAGTPYQVDVTGGAEQHSLGAYVSLDEAALALARFERVHAFVLAGCDPELQGHTISLYYELVGMWYRCRLLTPAGETFDGRWLVSWENEQYLTSEEDLSQKVWRVEAPSADATDPTEPLYLPMISAAGSVAAGSAAGSVAAGLAAGSVAADASSAPKCLLETAKEVRQSGGGARLTTGMVRAQAVHEGIELRPDAASESGFEGVRVVLTATGAKQYIPLLLA